jgi:hypothetical protein
VAAAWPVVQDVKNWLRILGDSTDDDVITQALAAATQWVISRVDPKYVPTSQGSDLTTLTLDTGVGTITSLIVDALPHDLDAGEQLTLFSAGNSLLCTVAQGGADTGDAIINIDSISSSFDYPIGTEVVETYTGPLSDALFQAVVMEAGRLYRRRDSVDGTVGWGDLGVVRVGPKDPEIETLLAAYLSIVV